MRKVTAYFAEHVNCGRDRDNGRPSVLSMFKRLGEKPRYSEPGLLPNEFGSICPCLDHYPIKANPGLPLTIATTVHGWSIIAIKRLSPAIAYPIFRLE